MLVRHVLMLTASEIMNVSNFYLVINEGYVGLAP